MEASCSQFTAAEGGARLAAAAASKNILAVEYASFIPVRLLYEKAYQIRGSLFDGQKRSAYVTRASRVKVVAYELRILTDLAITEAVSPDAVYDWVAELDSKEVIVCTSEVLHHILSEETLAMSSINVLVLDSCHLVYEDDHLKYIMQQYNKCNHSEQPVILGLTYPLFTTRKKDDKVKDKATEYSQEEEKNKEDSKTNEKEAEDSESRVLALIEDVKEKDELGKTKAVESVAQEVEMGTYENSDDFDMYEKLEWKIEELEKTLCCQMDLAEDIDGGKRLAASITKPRELIIEYSGRPTDEKLSEEYLDLERYMKDTINEALEFITDHRHDPTEIYGEELYEEFMSIPEPTIDPKIVFKHFLYVLEQLGPYAADKAAISLLTKLEKLKIKTPYERHFLLLCLCTTVFVKIRCYADLVFSRYESDWDKVQKFCTPKVLRFAEILEKFQPPEVQAIEPKNKAEYNIPNDKTETIDEADSKIDTTKMLNELDKCDFAALGDKIQDSVNIIVSNLKDIDYVTDNAEALEQVASKEHTVKETEGHIAQIVNLDKNSPNSVDNKVVSDDNGKDSTSDANASQIDAKEQESKVDNSRDKMACMKPIFPFPRRTGRARGRSRVQRSNAARVQQMQLNPDALCGIVYMKEALIAKILFMLIVDISRCNRKLSYLCAQYCATERPADPSVDPKECQRQGKKQEEVLKKFRMHECNLLLATSALEEGIDLPRCNLVLRWDVPPSYRSYGVCRGRARASRATAALLCSHSANTTDVLLQHLATYRELDQIISRKCGCGVQDEPPQSEEDVADKYTPIVKPYTPHDDAKPKNDSDVINIGNAVATNIIDDNKYNIDRDVISVTNKIAADNKTGAIDLKFDSNINNDVDSGKAIDETQGICNDLGDNNDSFINDINNDDIPKVADNNMEVSNDKNIEVIDENEKCDYELNEKNELINNDLEEIDVSRLRDGNSVNDLEKKLGRLGIESEEMKDFAESEVENIPESVLCNAKQSDVGKVISCNKCSDDTNSVKCSCDVRKDTSDKDGVSKSESKKILNEASVDLSSAITLINRYCGKLPSDTFTRLAPQYWMEEVQLPVPGSDQTRTAYICTLRLPLNCPVKYNIVGHPMPTKVLAKRMVALQACRILHKSGELDDQLMPIGKENFKAVELEASGGMAACVPGDLEGAGDARPGTTKRRQYYYKRTAYPFTDCEPVLDATDSELGSLGTPTLLPESAERRESPPPKLRTGRKRNMLYAIVSTLWCSLPERYNTRGRRLHAPQHAKQAIGILMARDEPDNLQIPAFPVYTRSGEVRVSVEYVPDADVRVTPRRATLIRRFMRFVFAEVLRVRRRGMKLQSEGSTHNNYYIVPTVKSTTEDGTTKIDIDWPFLELIYQHTEDMKNSELEKPMLWRNDETEEPKEMEKENEGEKDGKVKKMENPLLKPGEVFVFDTEKYREAVVTPWYRNQDQPQFFLVAEICWNLTPDSAFPSATHTSFREYYSSKYGVTLTQPDQPLLDVDHTSARLNLLTPRYVNRKGVALPVSSERTRRAKRDRLDQKQILVPELCRVHPFAAPLWFATVALPCVLYRINALLIADEIRRAVAIEVGLGIPKISEQTLPGFQWPALDFGWSLAEVLSADSEKNEKKKEEETKREQREKELKSKEETPPVEGEVKQEEVKEKTLNEILQEEKEDAESCFEIGTWSNDMASSIPQEMDYDEFMEPLPPNITFCTSASGGANWSDPIEKPKSQFNSNRAFSVADSDCSYMSSDLDSDDTDLDYDGSDDDTDTSGFCSSKNSNVALGVRIEYKTAREAEAVDVERGTKVNPAPMPDPADDLADREAHYRLLRAGSAPDEYIEKFRLSVARHKQDIVDKGHLIPQDKPIIDILPDTKDLSAKSDLNLTPTEETIKELFPYGYEKLVLNNGQIDLKSIERNKRHLLSRLKSVAPSDVIKKLNCFSMVDVDIDATDYVNEKVANVGFDKRQVYESGEVNGAYYEQRGKVEKGQFEFDFQPGLLGHPGPSPSVILQALTMSNANDGINLERLETIGDSFLKFAITAYLYCAHPTVHEGKLSHMRSKQVSNLNLYRLGRSKRLGARMIASKFEPHDNWLPPCHKPPHTHHTHGIDGQESNPKTEQQQDATGCFIPYNLITQHSIPDKSIADCVEALIGAYLLECGPRGALLFMSWLGIRVLPCHLIPLPNDHPYVVNVASKESQKPTQSSPKRERTSSSSSECSSSDEESLQQQPLPAEDWSWEGRPVGSLRPYRDESGTWIQPVFGELKAPPSPLLRYIDDPEGELERMLSGYEALERTLQYRFRDRSLLLQALTHASHQSNRLTDCYQRLEFLGDAILDYLITRHLYEDPRRHSPGALTDLRSALVNNTIFATLAARHGFHKYFRHMSPGLNEVLMKYVKIQEENGHSISEEHYLIQEDEMEQAEDVEVPKALGDLFESVAGAIFLDSGMSLDAVWRSYVTLMGAELEAFSAAAPKSPVRELLEAEPDTAKFGKPERLADGRRVRVCVEVFGRGAFKGVGRNYRIAKGTAARCALRHLRERRAR